MEALSVFFPRLAVALDQLLKMDLKVAASLRRKSIAIVRSTLSNDKKREDK
jgi:hypothetical protein